MDLSLPPYLETKIQALAQERMLTPAGVVLNMIELAFRLEEADEGDRLYHCETCEALNAVVGSEFVCQACGRKNDG